MSVINSCLWEKEAEDATTPVSLWSLLRSCRGSNSRSSPECAETCGLHVRVKDHELLIQLSSKIWENIISIWQKFCFLIRTGSPEFSSKAGVKK